MKAVSMLAANKKNAMLPPTKSARRRLPRRQAENAASATYAKKTQLESWPSHIHGFARPIGEETISPSHAVLWRSVISRKLRFCPVVKSAPTTAVRITRNAKSNQVRPALKYKRTNKASGMSVSQRHGCIQRAAVLNSAGEAAWHMARSHHATLAVPRAASANNKCSHASRRLDQTNRCISAVNRQAEDAMENMIVTQFIAGKSTLLHA